MTAALTGARLEIGTYDAVVDAARHMADRLETLDLCRFGPSGGEGPTLP